MWGEVAGVREALIQGANRAGSDHHIRGKVVQHRSVGAHEAGPAALLSGARPRQRCELLAMERCWTSGSGERTGGYRFEVQPQLRPKEALICCTRPPLYTVSTLTALQGLTRLTRVPETQTVNGLGTPLGVSPLKLRPARRVERRAHATIQWCHTNKLQVLSSTAASGL